MRRGGKDERPEVVGQLTRWRERMNGGTLVRSFLRTKRPPRLSQHRLPLPRDQTAATNTFGSLNAGLSRKAARSTVPMR